MLVSAPLLLFLGVVLGYAEPAPACSLQNVGIARGTAPFFVFSATPDTLPVPAPHWWTGGYADASPGATSHGQIVQISRIGGDSVHVLERVLQESDRQAVLVPWSVDPGCRTIGWTGASTRWIESPTPAFVSASLRRRSDWAEGLPTFDVATAYLEPYPHEAWLQARHFRPPPEDPQQQLTAEEYFELYAALPTFEEWRQRPEESYQRIREWVQAHPRLASRYPANTLVEEAEEELRLKQP